jgi:hypothetical protein
VTTQARERLLGYLATRPSWAGWAGRRLGGVPAPDDGRLGERLARGLAAAAGPDGSVGGSLVRTARAVIELAELDDRSPALDRMTGWLLARQNQPGAFHEGCTAARHQHGACEHFLGGFFSPAPPSRRAVPVELPNGRVYRVESQARFAASCLALEAVVRAGRRFEPAVERHLDSFGALVEEWSGWGDFLVPDLAFGAIGALGAARDRWTPILTALVDVAEAHQMPDGTWPAVDFFHALGGLAQAGAAAEGALGRARPTLLQRQRDDGSFGSAAADERALIALRVLLAADG